MRKAELKLGGMAISLLLVSGVLVGMFNFHSSMSSIYSTNASNFSWVDTTTISENMVEGMYERVTTGFFLTDLLGWVWNLGMLVLSGFLDIYKVGLSFISFASSHFDNLPSWFLSTVTTIVLFVIGYKVSMALLNREGRI